MGALSCDLQSPDIGSIACNAGVPETTDVCLRHVGASKTGRGNDSGWPSVPRQEWLACEACCGAGGCAGMRGMAHGRQSTRAWAFTGSLCRGPWRCPCRRALQACCLAQTHSMPCPASGSSRVCRTTLMQVLAQPLCLLLHPQHMQKRLLCAESADMLEASWTCCSCVIFGHASTCCCLAMSFFRGMLRL